MMVWTCPALLGGRDEYSAMTYVERTTGKIKKKERSRMRTRTGVQHPVHKFQQLRPQQQISSCFVLFACFGYNIFVEATLNSEHSVRATYARTQDYPIVRDKRVVGFFFFPCSAMST